MRARVVRRSRGVRGARRAGLVLRLRDERGVSAVIVALSLTAIFGAALMSIDSGSVWRARRAIVTGTDAAALAAARYIDAGGPAACSNAAVGGASSGAGNEAGYVLGQNDPKATLEQLVATPLGGSCARAGHVRVDARAPVSLSFAPSLGIKDTEAFASSTAQWGPLVSTSGMRPIAVCDQDPNFKAWTAYMNGTTGWTPLPGDPSYGPGHVVKRVTFQKQNSSACGSSTGNWGWLDFNDNSTPNGDTALNNWLVNGYGGTISLGDSALGIAMDCDPEATGSQACFSNTGAHGNSIEGSLEYLRDNAIVFPIIIFDRIIDQEKETCSVLPPWDANGSNTSYCPVAFLLVRVWGWHDITGNAGYFDLEFVDEFRDGQIGSNPAGGRADVEGVQLCGGNYGSTIDENCDV
jgi:hypothetical protein